MCDCIVLLFMEHIGEPAWVGVSVLSIVLMLCKGWELGMTWMPWSVFVHFASAVVATDNL